MPPTANHYGGGAREHTPERNAKITCLTTASRGGHHLPHSHHWRRSFSPVSAGAILYSGILSSAFNYACMAYVNGKTSPIVVMAFYPLQSLLTPVLSAAFLNTTLRVSDIITGIVIIVGLATLIYGRSMELRDAVGTAVMSALPTQLNGNTASRPPLKSIAPGKGLSAPIEIEIGAAPSTLKASEATSLLSRA